MYSTSLIETGRMKFSKLLMMFSLHKIKVKHKLGIVLTNTPPGRYRG